MIAMSSVTTAPFQQRLLGFLLVALQAAALFCFFRTPLFSAAVSAAALAGLLSRWRPVSPKTAHRWTIALAVCYIVQRQVVPSSWYSGANSYLFAHACLIAEYFLVFQVGQFFVRRDGDRLPSYLPILAIVAMTFTADVRVNAQGRVIFQLIAVGLIAMSAGFFTTCRLPDQPQRFTRSTRRDVLLIITLLIIAAVGWGTSSGLYRYARQIEMAMGAVLSPSRRPESAGFSGQGRLGSVARQKGTAGSRVALRVVAADEPGYLRGRAFDTYTHSEWTNEAGRMTLLPDATHDLLPATPASARNDRTFVLREGVVADWSKMEIWPNVAFKEVVFTPPGTAALQAPVDRLSMNLHGIIESQDMPPTTPYAAWTPGLGDGSPVAPDLDKLVRENAGEVPQRIAVSDWQRLTSLPETLDPRIAELAARVTGGAKTDGEKIAAIERYFLDNYQYQFGISVPGQADPLTYFLLEKPAAHCEYFASGAAVLLRASGIPCRYVTGFVVSEPNDYGGYWVARNRDAHAWAEAYDSQRGWVLVEATPTSGVPDAVPASAASQIWDAMRARWQQVVTAIRDGGVRAILQTCVWLASRPLFLAGMALIAAGFACRRWWRRRRQRSTVRRDPLVEQLHALLHRMDRRCKQIGLTRQPHETLHQFAERVESASPDPTYRQTAAWYRQAATLRYSGQINADTIQLLQESLRPGANPAAIQ
jgi:transglutaminase-like putative cysteine protease